MLPRASRITEKKDFARIFAKGAYLSLPLCILRWQENSLGYSRFGFVVANTISKKATVRNTIKRRLRECVRKNLERFPQNADIVFIAKHKLVGLAYRSLEGELLSYGDKMKNFRQGPPRQPRRYALKP